MDMFLPCIHPVSPSDSPSRFASQLTNESANTTGTGGWEEALAKAKDFVSKLTLEEKSNMVTGTPGPCVGNIVSIPRLGFPGLCLQDGPLAIRVADYASTFPAGVSTAASWDRELMYERGAQMGAEFKGKGAHVALGYVFLSPPEQKPC
jgi:beta-glucosidase